MRTFLLIGLCLFSFSIKAQVNRTFVDYLSKNDLKKEHFAYLKNVSDKITHDSLSYLKANYYLQYFNDSLFFMNYSNCRNLFINDTLLFNKANILFLKPGITNQHRWFNSFDDKTVSFVSQSIKQTYFASVSPMHTKVADLPIPLQKDFLKYKKNYNKKPFIGGALSTILPGLGKLYAGKKKSFATTLFTHVIYGVQSYESIRKLGIKNPFTVFSLSFFGVFYISNIYGSYRDVIQVKKETKTQFLINASDYYNFNYSYNTN